MLKTLLLILTLTLRAEDGKLEDLQKQVASLQHENVTLKQYIIDSEAFRAKDSTVMRAALAACMGQPPQPPKDEKK